MLHGNIKVEYGRNRALKLLSKFGFSVYFLQARLQDFFWAPIALIIFIVSYLFIVYILIDTNLDIKQIVIM